MKDKQALIVGAVVLVVIVWLMRQNEPDVIITQDGQQQAPSGIGGDTNIIINNPAQYSPIELPPHSDYYASFYTTNPGIPDVSMQFDVHAADMDWGYIPLFGLIGVPGEGGM